MNHHKSTDFGLLILRITIGLLLFISHGMDKLSQIGTDSAAHFLPIFGLSPHLSHFIAACAEGIGSIFIIIGLFTRFTSLLLIITMTLAALVAIASNTFYPLWIPSNLPEYKVVMSPFKEYSLLYGSVFFSLIFSGAGRYSIDEQIKYRLPYFLKFLC
ncbi:MAG: DoxX family protein [Bacteriovorax sp.]|nr:DoxX family protein [Bacteriovorax sp.]